MADTDYRQVPFDPQAFLAKGSGRANLKFPAGSNIYAQGDPADAIYYLQQGKAKGSVTSSTGKEAVVAIFGAGDFFGESSLLGSPARIASVIAITDVAAMRIEKSAMIETLNKEPGFADVFISYLLRRKRRVEDDLIDQLFNSSEKRLARALLLLANFGQEDKSEPILPQISQETLAEMIGTTRSRVSYFMTKFRKRGLVDYKGHLRVHRTLLSKVLGER